MMCVFSTADQQLSGCGGDAVSICHARLTSAGQRALHRFRGRGLLWVLGVLAALSAGCGTRRALTTAPGAAAPPAPTGIAFVKEMDYVPEVDSWEKCSLDSQHVVHPDSLARQWRGFASRLAACCTPELLRQLSRDAALPAATCHPLLVRDDVSFTPVTCHPRHRKRVFALELAALPAQLPGVSRRLVAYALYDQLTGTILRVTVTIRGERGE